MVTQAGSLAIRSSNAAVAVTCQFPVRLNISTLILAVTLPGEALAFQQEIDSSRANEICPSRRRALTQSGSRRSAARLYRGVGSAKPLRSCRRGAGRRLLSGALAAVMTRCEPRACTRAARLACLRPRYSFAQRALSAHHHQAARGDANADRERLSSGGVEPRNGGNNIEARAYGLGIVLMARG